METEKKGAKITIELNERLSEMLRRTMLRTGLSKAAIGKMAFTRWLEATDAQYPVDKLQKEQNGKI